MRKEHLIIRKEISVVEFFEKVEAEQQKTFVVTDCSGQLVGVISEGDVRRGRINGLNSSHIGPFINTNPTVVKQGDRLYLGRHHRLHESIVPVVDDEMKLVDILEWSSKLLISGSNIWRDFMVKAPARISLAGGGLDRADWFELRESSVVSFAVNRYVKVLFRYLGDFDDSVDWTSYDTGENGTYRVGASPRNLIEAVIQQFPFSGKISIEIFSDFSCGSGLGGSSAMTVALCSGFCKITNLSLTQFELAKLAYEIERADFGIRGGWQDQLVASYGGLLVMEFSAHNIGVTQLSVTDEVKDLVSDCFFIVRLGLPRESDKIHKALDRVGSNDGVDHVRIMEDLNDIAMKVREAISVSNWENLGNLIDQGWLLKHSISPEVDNRFAIQLCDQLKSFGASGARLMGAGKSGYVLAFVPRPKLPVFKRNCLSAGVAFESVMIDEFGARNKDLEC